jgi:hypothetical protein
MWTACDAVIAAVVSDADRLAAVAELLRELGRQCPGIAAHVVPQWRERPAPAEARASIAAALRLASRPWVLYLEDDAELAPDLAAGLADLLPLPESVGAASLFSPCPRDPERLRHGVRYYAQPAMRFTQCVLMRPDLALAWAEELDDWRGHPTSPDAALTPAADRLGLQIVRVLPSLAQHRPAPSAFGHHNQGVRSRTFGAAWSAFRWPTDLRGMP